MNENNPVFDELKEKYGKIADKPVAPNYIIEFIFIALVVGMLSFYAGMDVAHAQCEKRYGIEK